MADDAAIARAAAALKSRGVDVFVVRDRAAALEKLLELIPAGSEVYTMSSVTLDETGIDREIDGSGRFASVRKSVTSIEDKEKRNAARRSGSACEFATGSVHAITESGELVIVSQTGSQIAPYAYTAAHVVWVAGAQKIVRDLDSAFARIREYVVPLEDARMKKVYGPAAGTGINKILIFEKEAVPGRAKLILVREKLGF